MFDENICKTQNEEYIGVWTIIRYLWKLITLDICKKQSSTRVDTSQGGSTSTNNSKPTGLKSAVIREERKKNLYGRELGLSY